ncbi:proton channel OtopLc-like [Uloborus diversus]|uniref:proton channel OtopLc-like n=1 Tax=Uloborus diversus TaxID=327109 RepID=UPI0024090401|nr:proton channel OtopLc-like [Uloborus diversus]
MASCKIENDNRLSVESKESSYMGFDRGIDSDIEIDPAGDPLTGGRCSSEPHLKRRIVLTPKLARWESLDPPESGDSQTLVAPDLKIGELNNCVLPLQKIDQENELFLKSDKQTSTPRMNDIANHKTSEHGNSILPSLEVPTTIIAGNQNNAGTSYTSIGTHSHVGFVKYYAMGRHAQQSTSENLMNTLSFMYAKLLIVMGICFPVSEVISKRIPTAYYEGFYLYLYGGSVMFLFFIYRFILKTEKTDRRSCREKLIVRFRSMFRPKNILESFEDCNRSEHNNIRNVNPAVKSNRPYASNEYSYIYLRFGVVAFGIASMIYSGLELGDFFELKSESHCYNILHGVGPAARIVFTFIQMYFIFLNSQVCIKKFKIPAKFGLMHIIATNICVWLHLLVQETKHGILNLLKRNATTIATTTVPLDVISDVDYVDIEENFTSITYKESNSTALAYSHHEHHHVMFECRRANIMGELLQEASRFLFPCTIQFSLICAAILYIMWKNVGKKSFSPTSETMSSHSSLSAVQRHHYQVDCTKAHKGLFTGIIVLVMSIISIILFFVFISKPDYKGTAITEARITELGIYLITAIAVVIALHQVQELKFNMPQNTELDHTLLIIAQSGLYLFTMFSIISSHFTDNENTLLVLLTSLACIIQATLQTIFILDASHCVASTAEHLRKKPGRQFVTFLLVCNFAMWIMNTLQIQRSDSNPVQLEFYGFWAWSIVTYITTPLCIYFRFHSTVCLFAIWKKVYKISADFV